MTDQGEVMSDKVMAAYDVGVVSRLRARRWRWWMPWSRARRSSGRRPPALLSAGRPVRSAQVKHWGSDVGEVHSATGRRVLACTEKHVPAKTSGVYIP